MHDLDIRYGDGRLGAVEVTAAADQDAIEFWNLICGGEDRWVVPDLVGGWTVSAWPTARANRLQGELPAWLRTLERGGIAEVRVGSTDHEFDPILSMASDLGIVHAQQGPTSYPGSIYVLPELSFEQSGGMVGDSGDPLADWIGEFLMDPKQADVLEKLRRSDADERHAFVLVPGFTSAPFSVAYLLLQDDAPLPNKAPSLPAEVSHVWAMSAWKSGRVLCWSPDSGWRSGTKVTTPP
jgi:hypothetical protein